MFNRILTNLWRKWPRALAANTAVPDQFALQEAVRRFEAGDLAGAGAIAGGIAERGAQQHAAWNLLGAIATEGAQHETAIRHFERAIALQPANAEYLSNCAEACRRAGWLDDAIEHCRSALAANPAHAGAFYNLALALHATGEIEQAHTAMTEACARGPDFRRQSAPLFMLCHHPEIDANTQLTAHRRWSELHARAPVPKIAARARQSDSQGKLRIGYLSGDFRRHALLYFIEPLFAHHDRDRFEIYCYSNTRRVDDITVVLRAYATHWRDITALSDEAAAALIEADRIDILIDLSGHTADNRLPLFARKPAPVQMSYVGYPNTTGLPTMDYRISDGYMDPPGVADAYYTETLVRLPHSLWCYRPPAPMPDVGPLPALQRGITTFGSMHNFTKLNRKVIELWARILARVPAAELLIAAVPSGETGAHLRKQFAAHGIDPARLRLVGKVNFDEYLSLYQRQDIGLDTFPYVGGTTTCESLWMGVPVVTLAGSHGVARAGVSLLSGAGLPELIAESPDRYVEIAVNLARDRARLAELRASLRARMQQSSLMDEAAFTRDFEGLLLSAHAAAAANH